MSKMVVFSVLVICLMMAMVLAVEACLKHGDDVRIIYIIEISHSFQNENVNL